VTDWLWMEWKGRRRRDKGSGNETGGTRIDMRLKRQCRNKRGRVQRIDRSNEWRRQEERAELAGERDGISNVGAGGDVVDISYTPRGL